MQITMRNTQTMLQTPFILNLRHYIRVHYVYQIILRIKQIFFCFLIFKREIKYFNFD